MWSEPGQADSNVALQRYVRCQDGNYHMQDAYGHNHSTFIVPLRVGHRNKQTSERIDIQMSLSDCNVPLGTWVFITIEIP